MPSTTTRTRGGGTCGFSCRRFRRSSLARCGSAARVAALVPGPIAARAAPARVGRRGGARVGHNVFWTGASKHSRAGIARARVRGVGGVGHRPTCPRTRRYSRCRPADRFSTTRAFAIVRWDRCDRAALERLEGGALDAGTPLYAVFFPFEMSEQRAFDRIPGKWSQVARVQDVTLWRLDAKAEITSRR